MKLAWLPFLCTVGLVNGYSTPLTDEQQLVRFLTSNYSRVGKPGFRYDEQLVVQTRFFPIKLQNLLEKDEALQMTVRIQLVTL